MITFNVLTHMFHNRRYIGEYKYRDIIHPNGIPAIVPLDLFEKVQDRMAQTKKAPAKHKAEDDYLLSPKLYCGNATGLWSEKAEQVKLQKNIIITSVPVLKNSMIVTRKQSEKMRLNQLF